MSAPLDLLTRPWALRPEDFAAIAETWPRLHQVIDAKGPEAFLFLLEGLEEKEELYELRGRTAIVPVRGVLMDEPDYFSRMFGESTYSGIRASVMEAAESARVDTILLDVNSPGGMVSGCNAAFDAVYAASAQKRTVAMMNGQGTSAAYWIAAGAQEIVASADALLGSIGVMTRFWDTSKMDAEIGVRRIEIRSKNAQKKNPNPATPEGAEQYQTLVDQLEEVMIAAIAKGRGVSEETVIADYGQGAVIVGQHAVDAGLADRLGSLDEVLDELNAAAAA